MKIPTGISWRLGLLLAIPTISMVIVTVIGATGLYSTIEVMTQLHTAQVDAQFGEAIKEARDSAATAVLIFVIWAGIALLVTLISGIFSVSRLSRTVNQLKHAMQKAGQDLDLTARLPVQGRDEVSETAIAYNRMMDALQHTLRTLTSSSQDISGAAGNVSRVSTQVRDNARAQADSATSTASSVEQLATAIRLIANQSANARSMAEQSRALAINGEDVALTSAKQMSITAESVASSAQLIQNLFNRSKEISGIVNVISDIAEQTNLLALNAAIEAARAGDQGRGFAVVADEVRKLAERTSSSTSEIATMIDAIQGDVGSAVNGLKINNDQVATACTQARSVATMLSQIREDAERAMGEIANISEAASGQSQTTIEISHSFESIATNAQSTHQAITEAVDTVSAMESIASTLQSETARFRL